MSTHNEKLPDNIVATIESVNSMVARLSQLGDASVEHCADLYVALSKLIEVAASIRSRVLPPLAPTIAPVELRRRTGGGQ